MREGQTRGQAASRARTRFPTEILCDPVANARTISGLLPDMISLAESAGLSIVAQHLDRALTIASRVAASGGARRE